MSLGVDTRDDERIADLRGEVSGAVDRCLRQGGDVADVLSVLAHVAGNVLADREDVAPLLVGFAGSMKRSHALARREAGVP